MAELSSENNTNVCLWETWWNVQRSIRYHNYRHAFFERYSRLVSGLNILLSSTAGAKLFNSVEDSNGSAWILMGILACLNTADLVYGTAKRSWHHRELRNKFIEIEKKFLVGRRKSYVSTETLELIEAEILSVETDEPAIYRNLDIFCHNEMIEAYYKHDSAEKPAPRPLNLLQKITRNYIRSF